MSVPPGQKMYLRFWRATELVPAESRYPCPDRDEQARRILHDIERSLEKSADTVLLSCVHPKTRKSISWWDQMAGIADFGLFARNCSTGRAVGVEPDSGGMPGQHACPASVQVRRVRPIPTLAYSKSVGSGTHGGHLYSLRTPSTVATGEPVTEIPTSPQRTISADDSSDVGHFVPPYHRYSSNRTDSASDLEYSLVVCAVTGYRESDIVSWRFSDRHRFGNATT